MCEAILEKLALSSAKYGRKTGHISTSMLKASASHL